MSFTNPWLVIAIVIVAILSVVASYYLVLLQRKKRGDAEKEKILQDELAKRGQRNRESIRILARAVIDDQVTITEASIRINSLAQALPLGSDVRERINVYQQIAEATAHIPIFERWKTLSKKEKAAYDKERESIEAKYQDFVLAVSRDIVEKKLI